MRRAARRLAFTALGLAAIIGLDALFLLMIVAHAIVTGMLPRR